MKKQKAKEERLTCKDHPKYQVKRKPRTLCEACWALWIFKQVFDAK